MCIRNAVKKDVKKLPTWGYYYKVLDGHNKSLFRIFEYHEGINEIPETEQENAGNRGTAIVYAGGHFFRTKKAALVYREFDQVIVKFKILRRDISHVGVTRKNLKTVLARRAEMINRVNP